MFEVIINRYSLALQSTSLLVCRYTDPDTFEIVGHLTIPEGDFADTVCNLVTAKGTVSDVSFNGIMSSLVVFLSQPQFEALIFSVLAEWAWVSENLGLDEQ